MKDDIIVSQFPKNATEEVQARIVNYQGYDLIDLRVWVPRKDGTGDVATRKGLTLNIELLPALKKAVLALEKALNKTRE